MTNPDTPASTMMVDYEIETDVQGSASNDSSTLQSKEQAKSSKSSAGYGYEMLLIAKENAERPLWFMQWAANAEILNDAGILDRVEKHRGLTAQDIQVGENEFINVLVAKTQHPLPTGTIYQMEKSIYW